MKNQIQIVDPKEYGIEGTKAVSIEQSFLPKQTELNSFTEQYSALVNKELNTETFKEARELRLKLVKVRTGIADVHKNEKAFFLASGKFVDALKNKLTTPIEQMEEKLLDIEKYEERIEKEMKEQLKIDRKKAFEPYGTDTSFLPLGEMTEEQFNGQLDVAKTAHEAKIKAEKEAEEKRIEEEKRIATERVEREKKEEEEREKQRLENIRLKKEADEREAEYKAEQEKRQKEQAKKDEEAKKERERLELIAKKEKEKADKIAADLKRKEDEERHLKEAEEKRLNDLKNADDKVIFKDFYNTFKEVKFPQLNSKEGAEISNSINIKLDELKKELISLSKKLV